MSDDVVIRISGQDAGGRALVDQLTASIEKNTASVKTSGDALARHANASTKAGREAEGAATHVRKLSEGMETLVTAIAAEKLLEFAASGVEAQLQLIRLSKETGASVESLSVLGLAARETGGSTEDLATAFRGLSRSQAEAQQGNGQIAEAYHAIGLSVTELAGLKPEELFVKVAQAQAHYNDGLGKSAALQQIFGRSAQTMLPLLHQVATEGFDAIAERARALGIVFDEESAAKAEALERQLVDLKAAMNGVAQQITEHLVPGLTDLAHGLTAVIATAPEGLKRAADYAIALAAAVGAAAVASKVLAAALTFVTEATPVGILVTALTALAAVTSVVVEHERAQQQAAVDAITTEGAHAVSARALTAEYDRLTHALDAGTLSAAEAEATKRKLKQVTEDLKALGPQYAIVLGDETTKYDTARRGLALLNTELERNLRLKKAELEVDLANLQRDEAQHLQRNAAVFGFLQGAGVTAPGVLANPEIGKKQDQVAAIDAALGSLETPPLKPGPNVVLPDLAAMKAKIAAIVAAIQADLKRLADVGKADEQQAAARFAQGLEDLGTYYAERRTIIQTQSTGEIADLERERAAIAKTPTSTPAEATQLTSALATLDAQIAEKRRGLTTALAGLTEEERKAAQQLLTEVAGANATLLGATGHTVEAARAKIESEVRALGDVIAKAFGPDVAAEVEERFRTTLLNSNDFDLLQQQAERTFAAIANRKAALDAQLASGTLGQQAHDDAVTALERANLPQLHAIGDAMVRIAQAANDGLGNPDLIAKADAFNAALEQLGVKTDRAAQAWVNFKDDAANALEGDLVTFLGSTIDHVTSLGDAFRQLALAAIGSIQQILAQLIVLDAVKLAKKTFGIGEDVAAATATTAAGATAGAAMAAGGTAAGTAIATGGVTAATAIGVSAGALSASGGILLGAAGALTAAAAAPAVANSAGGFLGFAEGGVIEGPGTGTSDSILARVSAGEGILTAETVRRIGPAAVHQLNAGAPVIQLRDFSHLRVPHFADGGVVGGADNTAAGLLGAMGGGATAWTGKLHVELAEGLVARHLESPAGEKIVITHIAKNPKRVRSALGVSRTGGK